MDARATLDQGWGLSSTHCVLVTHDGQGMMRGSGCADHPSPPSQDDH